MFNQKKWLSFIVVVMGLFVISFHNVAAADYERFIIGFQDEVDDEVVTSLGDRVEKSFTKIEAVLAELTAEEVAELKEHDAVSYIEEDQKMHINSQTIDWGVRKTGAPTVWKNGVTGKGVKIAILDSGVDIDHPDLNIAKGKSFVSYTDSYQDDNGHGTHVTGIIGARNNDRGIVGVANEASIYVAKVLDEKGDGYTSDVVKAIEWAIEEGVEIMNLSLSGHRHSKALEQTLDNAYNKGILFVAAAGNYGKKDGAGDTVDYPALYESVIAVSAIDHDMKRASFSATGPAVEVTAPGVSILSTFLQQDYAYISGTSMAAPHVVGHLALLKQTHEEATNVELRQLLKEQTLDLGAPGRDPKYGYGLIQIPADLRTELPRPSPPTHLTVFGHGWTGNTARIELNWMPPTKGEEVVAYEVYRNDKRIDVVTEPTYSDNVREGTYTYTVTALNREDKPSQKVRPLTFAMKKGSDAPQLTDSFTDMNSDKWYSRSIYELVGEGIILGYPDGSVRPNETITRADAAVMMSRALKKEPIEYKGTFIDVRGQSYAADYIQTMTEQGIFRGNGNNIFRPHDSIARGEIATVLNRAFTFEPKGYYYFTDVPSTYFAYEDIAVIAGLDIAQGNLNGDFKPRSPVTRAEFAVFLTRALNVNNSENIN